MEIYFILILQIVNILISGCVPMLSNFIQSISNSECFGLKIKRQVKQMRKSMVNIPIEDFSSGEPTPPDIEIRNTI